MTASQAPTQPSYAAAQAAAFGSIVSLLLISGTLTAFAATLLMITLVVQYAKTFQRGTPVLCKVAPKCLLTSF